MCLLGPELCFIFYAWSSPALWDRGRNRANSLHSQNALLKFWLHHWAYVFINLWITLGFYWYLLWSGDAKKHRPSETLEFPLQKQKEKDRLSRWKWVHKSGACKQLRICLRRIKVKFSFETEKPHQNIQRWQKGRWQDQFVALPRPNFCFAGAQRRRQNDNFKYDHWSYLTLKWLGVRVWIWFIWGPKIVEKKFTHSTMTAAAASDFWSFVHPCRKGTCYKTGLNWFYPQRAIYHWKLTQPCLHHDARSYKFEFQKRQLIVT